MFELITELALVELAVADVRVIPGNPTTPRLVEVRPPATPAPAEVAVFKVPLVALPAVFATCPVGLYDGFRLDVHGNLWLSAGDGVHCHASDGSLLGKIRIPESVANVCFGGPKLNRLFICGTTSLYSIYVTANGSKLG